MGNSQTGFPVAADKNSGKTHVQSGSAGASPYRRLYGYGLVTTVVLKAIIAHGWHCHLVSISRPRFRNRRP